jgi:hypothetical protein
MDVIMLAGGSHGHVSKRPPPALRVRVDLSGFAG